MLVLFEKMALLVIILAIGYICAKIKLVGPEFNKGLSKMVINVFLAGMILASVMNKELSMSKGDMLFGIAMLFVMQIVCFAVGMITPAAMRIKDGDKGMYKLITSFSNLSFMGVPVISAVYGEGAIFFASLGNIPFNVLLYTVGIMLLQSNGEKKEKISIKSMINVPIIATVIATVIFLFEIPMPVIVVDVADMLSDVRRPGRSPMSTQVTSASRSGPIVRAVFTLQYRTKNGVPTVIPLSSRPIFFRSSRASL